MSPLWQTRADSLAHMQAKHPSRLDVIDQAFALFDGCVDAFERAQSRGAYSNVCALAVLKAKNYALGSYSLTLDGLAQEAGALVRPLIEYAEHLKYFRAHPEATEQAIDGTLPKAGKIAMANDSIYGGVREHFNRHASHSSYENFSIQHLLDKTTFSFRKTQTFSPVVLETNLQSLIAQLILVLREAVLNVETANPTEFGTLGGRHDRLRSRAIHVFELDRERPPRGS